MFSFTLASDQQVHDELCRRLKTARISAAMTQAELAEASGMSINTISRLERGTISPTLASIIAVLRALGLIEQLDAFLPMPPPQPLKHRQHKEPLTRERVRKPKRKASKPSESGWRWGDEK